MDDRQADPRYSPAPRRKRRLLKSSLALALLTIVLVVAGPWLLGTPTAREFLVGRINARLAPGSLRLKALDLTWSGPITLDGVALVDPKGKTVLAASRVTLDRGLLGLIASRPDYGTVTVEGAAIDLERRADGTVDLLDALAAVTKEDPPAHPQVAPAAMPLPRPAPAPAPEPSRAAVTVIIKDGTLKLAALELVEPLSAGSVNGRLTMAPGKPIEVKATLGEGGRSLELRSTVAPGAAGDLTLSVAGKDWPIHVRHSGVEAKGTFVGNLEAGRTQGLWSLKGDAALVGLDAGGPTLQGDRLKLDRVAATCDVAQAAGGWSVRKLDLTSPVASIRGGGTIPAVAGTPTQLLGKIDLAALATMLPNAMRLRDNLTLDRGTASIRLDVTSEAGVDRVELVASLDDFAATEAGKPVRLRRPAYLTGKATRSPTKVVVEALEVKAAGVDVTAEGDLEAGVKLAGTVDLVALTAQLRDVLDLGTLDLSGHARLAADYRHAKGSYKGRFALEGKDLKVVGATAEPIARDLARFDGWAVGPAKGDGTPGGWQQARIDLKAGDLKLDVQATSAGNEVGLVAGFEVQVASPVAGRFDAKATLRKLGTAYEVAELAAGITPNDSKAASGVVALAVRGRFDSATGAGAFGPIPGYAIGAIGLGAEGVKLTGVGRSGMPLGVDAGLCGDLAALDGLLAAWTGAAPKGLGGLWATQVAFSRSAAGKVDLDAKGFVPSLAVSGTTRGPVSLGVRAGYTPGLDRLDLGSLDLVTQFGHLAFAGGMAEATARRFLSVTGTFEPNWAAVDPIIDPSGEGKARVRATVRPIRLAAQLKADSTPQLLTQVLGEIALDVTEARAYGVTVGPTPLVLRLGAGLAKFEPIRTTMNDGPVTILADLVLDDADGVWLRLGASKIEGAAINEAVSNSILAYVAPVLAKSSAVSGQVTAAIQQARVPITAAGSLSLDGALALQNVVFKPGPLGDELASLTGRSVADMKLNQAMFVKVRDGRVEQHGLSIPLGANGVAVAIDGSVGFDETLDLKATVPIAATQAGPGASAALPIGGTLARPAIDRKALSVALRDAAKAMGEKRLKSEAGRLLDRLAGPKQSSGEPRSKPAGRNPLGDLEHLGREILDPKKP